MDTVKINFLGFWDNFDKNNNKITQALKKNFKVQISNNPDFVFYTFWLKGSRPYGEHVKIFYSYEPDEIEIDDYNYLITCRKDFYPNSDKILTYHPIPGLNIFQKQKISTKLTKENFAILCTPIQYLVKMQKEELNFARNYPNTNLLIARDKF